MTYKDKASYASSLPYTLELYTLELYTTTLDVQPTILNIVTRDFRQLIYNYSLELYTTRVVCYTLEVYTVIL